MVFLEQVNGCILAVFCMVFGWFSDIKKDTELTQCQLGVLFIYAYLFCFELCK